MTTHQGRHFLQIPGPSPVPDRVLRAMDMPVIDHRSAQFAELGKTVLEGCQKIFKTSAPVIITVTAGTGLPYGLTTRASVPPFLNMPNSGSGSLPAMLSQTGVFTNTASMGTAGGLVPYTVNVPLWSDGALKTRWMAIPNNGAPYGPNQQIAFAPTGEWSFPSGSVFVKHFELVTNLVDANAPHRRQRSDVHLV